MKGGMGDEYEFNYGEPIKKFAINSANECLK